MTRPPVDWALDSGALREWAFRGVPGHEAIWARIEKLRAAGRIRLWVAASTLSAASTEAGNGAGPVLGPDTEALRLRLSDEMGRGLRAFTVDAASAVEALAAGAISWDAAMAHASFVRICPDGAFLTRNPEALSRLTRAVQPQEALKALEAPIAPAAAAATAKPANVPMLDLREEYRLSQPAFDKALLGAAASAQYILGPQVAEFERSLAGYLGASHAVGVSSGTEALVLALRALAMVRLGKERFDPSDIILTTPFTFVATGDAILRSGATPLFCDIDPATGNLDPAEVRRCLANPPAHRAADKPGKVVGMVPVHLFGRPCPMDDLSDLAAQHGLFVLEDVAQSFGATWKGRRLGSLGDASAFSFFPSKNLGGFGDAGGVATSDAALAETVSMLLRHGAKGKGTFDVLGYNARLDTLQAAVLLEKLPSVDGCNLARRALARSYIDALDGIAGLAMPEWPGEDPGSHVFHQFTLRTSRRDDLQARLAKDGISSMIYYAHPLHRMKLFEGRCLVGERSAGAGLPESERAAREVLSLPIGPTQGAASTAAVIASVKAFFAAA